MSKIFKSNEILINNGNRYMLKNGISSDSVKGSCGQKLRVVKEGSYEHHNKLLETVDKEAEKLLAQAEKKAGSLVDNAIRKAQQIKQKAQEEGYEAGIKEGTRNAQQLFFAELQEVLRLKSEILGEREKLYYQFERDLVNLAMDIAKKVIYNRLHHDDEALRSVIESTLQKVQGKAKVKLRISADDQQRIEYLKEEFMSKLQQIEDIEIVGDPHLAAGSCIVETENGIVDGSAQTRIKEIEMALSGG